MLPTRVARIRGVAALAIAGAVLGAIVVFVAAPQANGAPGSLSSDRLLRVAASYPAHEIADLVALADGVAIVRPTGTSRTKWNSASNREWVSDPESAPQAYIYREDEMVVLESVRGTLEGRIWVRSVGGKVDDVAMINDGQVQWIKGETYLLLLALGDWPTREGSERAWGTVWMDHGVLRPLESGAWVDRAGREVSLQSLRPSQP